MTQALYLSDITQAEVEVLKCEPTEDGRFAIQLSNTPFYPQGGGQPSDVGKINDADVLHVVMQNDQIIHYSNHATTLGLAQARVDLNRRRYHSRLHSAGHLIGHVMQAFGWEPTKAQHWPEECKVQFVKQDHSEDQDLETLELLCNQYISSQLVRLTQQNADGYREVSFGDLPAFPCGGTHVQNLSEIGTLEITSYKLKKDKLTVSYRVSDEHQ
ncbi:alanyl-tRNA editing protein [Acinetobacter sp. WCHAc060042]|uniref:alanyl-tRNA editing protein n=1 Tax=Acinetobacter sp. WCHAc060042 TaxID=2213016 RepID=UPI000DA678C4|nr:alanyl-tRNA editing protein [Acinetobacter sp. WCHAc060042]